MCSGELIKTTITGQSQLGHYQTYLVMIAFLASSVAQVYLLNRGLEISDSMLVIPVFFATWAVCSVLGGALYYQELASFNAVQLSLFLLGMLFLVFGIALLAQRTRAHSTIQCLQRPLTEVAAAIWLLPICVKCRPAKLPPSAMVASATALPLARSQSTAPLTGDSVDISTVV